MSKVIDNRVVSMEFDNSQFEKNVQTSMKTLDGLNKTLDNLPETSGKKIFGGLSKAAGNIDLSGISSGIDAINSKFSALGIAGQEVIRDITRSAINFGKNAWNMTFGQITSGGKRRSQNIASAKFTLEGMGFNFQDYYKDIDYAVTGTAYGFDQAAQAASVFASSGVKAGEDMKQALRGISGVAAMTGASYDEIAYVFEKVNGMGKVTGETLNMISGRGLNAAAALGKALGKSEEEIHKMVTKGQIDFATFAKAMDDAFGEHSTDADKTLSGVTDNIRAQLSRIGQTFYDPIFENDSGVVKMLQSVKAKIKEIKPLIDPFSEAMADLVLHMASVGKDIIDSFDVSGIGAFFNIAKGYAVDAKTGFDNLVNAITTIAKKLSPLKKAAQDAFGEIFPKKGNVLSPIITITRKISDFATKLVITGETVDKFKRIFKGGFSAISLGIKILKNLYASLSPVTTKLKEFGSGLFEAFAKVGDFITSVNQKYGNMGLFDSIISSLEELGDFSGLSSLNKLKEGISQFFKDIYVSYLEGGGGLGGVIEVIFDKMTDGIILIISWIEKLTGLDLHVFTENIVDKMLTARNAVVDFVNDMSVLDTLKDKFGRIKEAAAELDIGDKFKAIFAKITGGLKAFWDSIAPIRKAVATVLTPLWNAIKQIGQAISDGLAQPGGFINLAAMMVIFEHLRLKVLDLKFAFQDFKKYLKLLSGKNPFDFANNLDKTVGAVKSSLFQLTKELKAKAILEIAAAIGILAISFMLLASVDSDKIAQASVAMGELLLAIAGLMKEMDSLGDNGGLKDAWGSGTKISSLSTALIKISVAVLILAAAMKQMDGLENAFQSVGVLTVVLLELVGVAYAMNKLNLSSFSKVATSMILMSVAVKILASAITSFDGMSWENVGQGLVSITVLMAELVGVAVAVDKLVKSGSFTKTAAGMILLATAVKLLASSVQTLGNMNPQNLAAGMLAVTGSITMLVIACIAIDKLVDGTDFAKISAGFLMLGLSIRLIASAFVALGNMNPDGVAQAMGMLTFALAGLAVILLLANDSMLKAGAGMLLLAVAMNVFVAAVAMIGSMELGTLMQGMIGLAAGLTILAVAMHFIQGSLLGAAALLVVAIALVPFAAALMMLTSLNLADLAGTILVLVVALAALVVVCYAMSGALIGAAALLVLSVALLAFGAACAILTALPLGDMAATLLVVAAALLAFAGLSLLLTPLLVPMAALAGVMLLISAALVVLGVAVMAMGVGMQMMAASGTLGTTALLMFCTTLATNLAMLGKASVVLTGLATALLVLDAALIVAAVSIAACGVALGILTTAMLAFSIAAVVFSAALLLVCSSLKVGIESLKKMLNEGEFRQMAGNAISGIIKGFKEGLSKVIEVVKELGQKVIDKIKSFFGAGSDSKMGQAGGNAVQGFIAGFKAKISSAVAVAGELGKKVLGKVKSVLKIKSPSREMEKLGRFTDEGFANGIRNNASDVTRAADDMSNEVIDSMSGVVGTISDAMAATDVEPTITPQMDLTQIQNGVDSMNSLLDQKRAANISANFNAGKMYEQEQIAFTQAQLSGLGSQLSTLAAIMANQPTPEVNANVILQGDADGVFKLVQNSNNRYTKMHGKSAFA